MAWSDELRPASFRGLLFGVRGSRSRFGRRNAVHEYPFRDRPFAEDLGRASRSIQMVGFLVEGDPLSGGSSVIQTRDELIALAETEGSGELVHPTLGHLNVSLMDLEVEESWNHGRVFMLHFSFMEAGDQRFPQATVATTAVAKQSVLAAYAQTAIEYRTKVTSLYRKGAAVVRQVEATAALFVRQVQDVADDATNIYNAVTNLPGTLEGKFGRFFGARNRSGSFASQAVTTTSDVASLLAAGTVSRLAVQTASAGLTTSSAGNDPDAISASVQQIVTSVQTAAVDPADGVRVLLGLLDFTSPTLASTGVIGVAANDAAAATGDVFRRSVVTALVEAALAYQPSSYDDAANLRALICDVLDEQIDIAGDQAADGMFDALRDLRAALALDLETRGATLATIATFKSLRSMPADAWAQRIYRDPSRTDQLIGQVSPRHPLFMPTTFLALSS